MVVDTVVVVLAVVVVTIKPSSCRWAADVGLTDLRGEGTALATAKKKKEVLRVVQGLGFRVCNLMASPVIICLRLRVLGLEV